MNFKTLKKALSVFSATALVACFCIPAFAAAPTVTASNTAPKKGDIVTYTITADTADPATAGGFAAKVTATGLTFKGVTGAGNLGSDANNAIIVPVMGGNTITYEYEVTGEAGSQISFELSNMEGSDANGNATTPIDGTVVETATVAGATQATTAATTTAAKTTTTAATAGSNTSPKTGDNTFMWVFATTGILAAVAVIGIALKKASISE